MKRKEDVKESAAENAAENAAESSLLRTYFVSLFSCLICCVMFLGTTYAWFSGNVTSASNQIKTGMFHVELWHEGTDIVENPEHVVFTTSALGPGHNAVTEELELKNAGELRVGYSLGLDIVRDDDNIKQYFWVSVKTGENWSEPQNLVDGFEIGKGELAPKESLPISVKITLDTSAPDIKGKELAVVLFLQTQQVLGSGGNI